MDLIEMKNTVYKKKMRQCQGKYAMNMKTWQLTLFKIKVREKKD